MVVRVRLQPSWKLFLGLAADLLIVGGVGGILVWLWGLSDGAVYQYTQNAHFSRETAGGDFGLPGMPRSSKRARGPALLAGWPQRCPSAILCF
ncbi:MAG: hypothetical protein ACRD4E_15630 [Bryobacteraceae bacterium]